MAATAFAGVLLSGAAQSLGLGLAEAEAGLNHKALKRLGCGCGETTLKDRNGPNFPSSEHLGPVGNLNETKFLNL